MTFLHHGSKGSTVYNNRSEDGKVCNNGSGDGKAYNALGSSTSRAIQLVNRLRTVGADADVDLPRIAFAGKQSAGKSSLVEALTGIQLPRSHGTCTRCPIEVTTTRDESAPWCCTIRLRFLYDDATKVKLAKPRVQSLCTIGEARRAETSQLIQKAQAAILQEGNVKFTRNIICIEIRSKDCQDLSLVDLPGLIESSDTRDDEVYISLISDLVHDYIKSENTVILQCIASDEDVENQKIRTLARTVDPLGKRSIGVLTKPDKVEDGTEGGVVEILTGQKYFLHMGYFVVRTPNPNELTALAKFDPARSFEEGRNIEEKFFATSKTGTLFDGCASDRCGSKKLVSELSIMLKKMIDYQIPKMREKLQYVTNKTNLELEALGAAVRPNEAREALLEECRRFSAQAQKTIQATKLEKKFWHSVRDTFYATRRQLEDCGPLFEVNGKLVRFDLAHCSGGVELFVEREKAKNGDAVSSPTKCIGGSWWSLEFSQKAVRLVCKRLPKGSRRIKVKYVVDSLSAEGRLAREVEVSKKKAEIGIPIKQDFPGSFRIHAKLMLLDVIADNDCEGVFSVDDVRNAINQARGRELPLPGQPEYLACESYISESVIKWEKIATDCVKQVQRQLEDLIVGVAGTKEEALLNTIPSRFRLLRETAQDVIVTFVSELGEVLLKRVNELCLMQKNLFTFNEEAVTRTRSEFIATMRSWLENNENDGQSKVKQLEATLGQQFSLMLSKLGMTKEALVMKLSSNDHVEETEIETIAGALAYFRTKVSSFCDFLFDYIQFYLLDEFHDKCEKELLTGLGIYQNDDDQLMLYVQEDAVLAGKRNKLEKDRERQKEALELIRAHLRHTE